MVEHIENKTTQALQREGLQILKFFHDFCEDNDIKYILDYGTLLGAIRHEGFIPWDDDIDVAMTREDFEKFNKLYDNSESPYFLQTHETDKNYFLSFPKLRKSDNDYIEQAHSHFRIVHGPWIDIFVYDYTFESGSRTAKNIEKFNKSVKYLPLVSPMYFPLNYPNQNIFKNPIKAIIKFFLRVSQRMPGRGLIMKRLDKKYYITQEIITKSPKGNSSGDLITYSFDTSNNNLSEYELNLSHFNNRVLWKFCDYYFYVPVEYHSVLQKRYREYMELPSISDRISNHQFVNFKNGN